jgi:hypothetical protein
MRATGIAPLAIQPANGAMDAADADVRRGLSALTGS